MCFLLRKGVTYTKSSIIHFNFLLNIYFYLFSCTFYDFLYAHYYATIFLPVLYDLILILFDPVVHPFTQTHKTYYKPKTRIVESRLRYASRCSFLSFFDFLTNFFFSFPQKQTTSHPLRRTSTRSRANPSTESIRWITWPLGEFRHHQRWHSTNTSTTPKSQQRSRYLE